MNVTVFLESSISAFRMTGPLLVKLREKFPSWSFTSVGNAGQMLDALAQTDLLVTWRFKQEWYSQAPRLKGIFTPAAGREWVAPHPEREVPVFHGTFHGAIMAETLVGMMLYFNRRLPQIRENQSRKQWNRDFLGSTHRLGTHNVVLIGYGAIARHTARLLRPFGCRITGVKRSGRDQLLDRDADSIVAVDQLQSVVPAADHVVAILPGDSTTNRLITREHFASMKPDAHFYNIGRGNCYAESDLVWALSEKRIAGAGLDVFAEEPLPERSPLWEMPNVLVLPHASAISADYVPLFVSELTERLEAFL